MRQVAYAHSRLTVSLQDRLDHVDRIVLVSLADHLRDALLHELNETRAGVSEPTGRCVSHWVRDLSTNQTAIHAESFS